MPPTPPSEVRLGGRLGAEFLGTFGLVFGGCGAAVLAAKFLDGDGVQLGIGFVGVALAFGLSVLAGAFAFGHVSGGHFNPAVTVGLAVARRFSWREVGPYVVTQVVAATAAGGVLFIIAAGSPTTTVAQLRASGFATNGWGVHSPAGYGFGAALLTEIVLTAGFLYVILGATDDRANKTFAPIAIGLALTLIHLIGIPVTNTSVNPARSLGVAGMWVEQRSARCGCSSWPLSSAPSLPAPPTPASPVPATTSWSRSGSPTTPLRTSCTRSATS